MKPRVLCWMCREEAAQPSPCRIKRFYRVGRAKPSLATKLWQFGLFFAHLPKQPSLVCGVAGSEVSSGAGSCWGVFWGRQGTAVLGWCCEVWQNKFYRILQAAQPVCSWGFCPKLLGFSRKDNFFQQIGQCFPGIGDPSCCRA